MSEGGPRAGNVVRGRRAVATIPGSPRPTQRPASLRCRAGSETPRPRRPSKRRWPRGRRSSSLRWAAPANTSTTWPTTPGPTGSPRSPARSAGPGTRPAPRPGDCGSRIGSSGPTWPDGRREAYDHVAFASPETGPDRAAIATPSGRRRDPGRPAIDAVGGVAARAWRVVRPARRRRSSQRRILILQLDHMGDRRPHRSPGSWLRPPRGRTSGERRSTLLASPSNRLEVFEANPEVDRVHLASRNWFEPQARCRWAMGSAVWAARAVFAGGRYDLGIDVRGDILSVARP